MDERAQRTTWRFALAILAAGAAAALFAGTQLDQFVEPPFGVSWLILALGFGLTERFSVDIEVRREAHALTFSELVLTTGLIFADPFSLVLGRIVGGVLGI